MDRVLLANRARHNARLVQLKVSEDLRVTVGGADQDGVGDLRPTERLPFDNLLPGTQPVSYTHLTLPTKVNV